MTQTETNVTVTFGQSSNTPLSKGNTKRLYAACAPPRKRWKLHLALCELVNAASKWKRGHTMALTTYFYTYTIHETRDLHNSLVN